METAVLASSCAAATALGGLLTISNTYYCILFPAPFYVCEFRGDLPSCETEQPMSRAARA